MFSNGKDKKDKEDLSKNLEVLKNLIGEQITILTRAQIRMGAASIRLPDGSFDSLRFVNGF
jgi:hypothetical protein